MKTEQIKDFSSCRILGTVETDFNGDKTVREFPSGKIVGYYRAGRNVTTDFTGRSLAYGDVSAALIYTYRK